MKTALVLCLSLAASVFAADPKTDPAKAPDKLPQEQEQVKRLGALTWNPEAHKLQWVVQMGKMVNGEFVPSSEQQYEISPDDAVMAVSEEQRGFDGAEAASLHHLLDVLSLYCAESVVWWDQGQGTPVDPHTVPGKSEKPKTDNKTDKPVKVGQPENDRKKKYQVPPSQMVAEAQRQR